MAPAMCRKCSKNLEAISWYTGFSIAISQAMRSIFKLYIAIQPVPSACSKCPPVGNLAERSNTPMLSIPKNPPPKILFPPSSFRFTHQVKFNNNLWKMRSKKTTSPFPPFISLSISYTFQVAQACTGGFTSEKDHS